MGQQFRNCIVDMWDSWVQAERLIEVRHMVEDPGEDAYAKDYVIHYIASLCTGAFVFDGQSAGPFLASLAEQLRDWKTRGNIGSAFDPAQSAHLFLRLVIKSLLLSTDTSPALLSKVLEGSQTSGKAEHESAWDAIIEEFVFLTKYRFDIDW